VQPALPSYRRVMAGWDRDRRAHARCDGAGPGRSEGPAIGARRQADLPAVEGALASVPEVTLEARLRV